MDRYKLHTMNVYKFKDLQKVDHSIEKLCIDAGGDWVRYEDHAARIAELEAEIVERRKDYSACIRNQDARIAELEAQLFAAQERNTLLQEQLAIPNAHIVNSELPDSLKEAEHD
ncbi:MAG TPA: hypothetical protein PLH32_18110 [bacterium]|nr:hypothetical protein [bacterium]